MVNSIAARLYILAKYYTKCTLYTTYIYVYYMQLKAQTADARLRVGIPDNRIVHKSKKNILESITYMYNIYDEYICTHFYNI